VASRLGQVEEYSGGTRNSTRGCTGRLTVIGAAGRTEFRIAEEKANGIAGSRNPIPAVRRQARHSERGANSERTPSSRQRFAASDLPEHSEGRHEFPSHSSRLTVSVR
jgi:hypothetical protein